MGWHRFASGFVQAPGADFPRFRSALALTAVKFANGTILRDRLDNLVSEPLPAATKRLVAFQLLFGHGVEPHSDRETCPAASLKAGGEERDLCHSGRSAPWERAVVPVEKVFPLSGFHSGFVGDTVHFLVLWSLRCFGLIQFWCFETFGFV